MQLSSAPTALDAVGSLACGTCGLLPRERPWASARPHLPEPRLALDAAVCRGFAREAFVSAGRSSLRARAVASASAHSFRGSVPAAPTPRRTGSARASAQERQRGARELLPEARCSSPPS